MMMMNQQQQLLSIKNLFQLKQSTTHSFQQSNQWRKNGRFLIQKGKWVFTLTCILVFTIGLTAWFWIDAHSFSKEISNITAHHDHDDDHERSSIRDISRYHRTIEEPIQDSTTCGVGWKKVNTMCTRDLKWPSVVDSNLQSSADPCQDFYTYSCGAYASDPVNIDRDATFDYIHDLADRAMQDIAQHVISSIPASESKFTAFYQSCISFNPASSITQSKTLNSFFQLIDHGKLITEYRQLYPLWGSLQLYQTILPLELTFEINPLNASELIPLIKQSGIFESDPYALTTEEHYQDVYQRLEFLFSVPTQVKQWTNQIIAIEQALVDTWKYSSRASNLVDYIPQFEKDLFPFSAWEDTFNLDPDFNITEFMLAAHPFTLDQLKEKPLWVFSRAFLEALPRTIKQFPLKSWLQYTKHALLFHVLGTPNSGGYQKNYDARYSLPWQRPHMLPSFERNNNNACLDLTRSYLSNLLDNYYVFQYIPQELHDQVVFIAQQIKDTYIKVLSSYPQFAQKLASVKIQLAYPDAWPFKRTNLDISERNFAENVFAIRKYHAERSLTFYLNGNHSMILDIPISGADAYFDHHLNIVILNAGFINPPIFSLLFDQASQYSRLGFLIAHELTHAIDRIGIQFDTDGSYHPWLSNTEETSFLQHLSEVFPTDRTLNEDFADQMALYVSYLAFVNTTNPTLDEERNFFLSYAQLFCAGPERNNMLVSHSAFNHRVNAVIARQWTNEISRVFSCTPTKTPETLHQMLPLIFEEASYVLRDRYSP
jgi:predicted metalloendopeptidase